jgi:Cdc6-like AAA superfamily ATPase
MSTSHLTEDQVIRCAEALIFKEQIHFSDTLQAHVDKCKVCAIRVQDKMDALEKEQHKSIYQNLSMLSKNPVTSELLFALGFALLFIAIVIIAVSQYLNTYSAFVNI